MTNREISAALTYLAADLISSDMLHELYAEEARKENRKLAQAVDATVERLRTKAVALKKLSDLLNKEHNE